MKSLVHSLTAAGLSLALVACSSGPELPSLPSLPNPLDLFSSGNSANSSTGTAGAQYRTPRLREDAIPPAPAETYTPPPSGSRPTYQPPSSGSGGFGSPDGGGDPADDPFASDPYSSLDPAGGGGGAACGAGGKACG